MRDARPGKAIAVPMRIPAAPEMQIAKISVVPWIISQPSTLGPSPFAAKIAKKAPSISPL